MFSWHPLAFYMIQQMLAIWSLVPLPFLNPACTSSSSQFTYCWALPCWHVKQAQLCNSLNILWQGPSLGLEWKLTFSSPMATFWVFQICWHIECSTFTASSFRILNSSAGILSPPLALFVVMLPKACLTSYSRMSGCRWVITPLWLSGSLRSFFCTILLCILAASS